MLGYHGRCIIRKENGFTAIELICVMIIVASISAILAFRNIGRDFTLMGETLVMKSHLHYIQFLALSNESVNWKIEFNQDSYKLLKINPITYESDDSVAFPNEISSLHNLNSQVTLLVKDLQTGAPVDNIVYNKYGAPETDNDVKVRFTDKKLNNYLEFIIKKDTGFIQ